MRKYKEKICVTCNTKFKYNHSKKDECDKCVLSKFRSSKLNSLNREIECIICGDGFIKSRVNHKFCSKKCKEKSRYLFRKNQASNKKDKSKINERSRNRSRNRYKLDPIYKFIKITRSNINIAIKRSSSCKHGKTFDLLGCTGETAYNYIKSKFRDGMTEEDFLNGSIHIDHIRPIASFDLLNIEEQKRAFHYTNLQPLWAEENMVKGSKWRGRRYYYKKGNK